MSFVIVVGIGLLVALVAIGLAVLYRRSQAAASRSMTGAASGPPKLAKGTAARRRKSAKRRRSEQRKRRSDDDTNDVTYTERDGVESDDAAFGAGFDRPVWSDVERRERVEPLPAEPARIEHSAVGDAVGEVEKVRSHESTESSWSSSSESSSSYDSSSSSYSDSSSSSDSGGSSYSDS